MVCILYYNSRSLLLAIINKIKDERLGLSKKHYMNSGSKNKYKWIFYIQGVKVSPGEMHIK